MSEEQQKDACADCEKHLAGWKRALADYDNLKKDLARLRTETRDQSRAETVTLLLPVLNHFDQAVAHAPGGEHAQWMKGILHVKNQLEDVLKQLGAEPFAQIGDAFDPYSHEAVAQETVADKPDQSVLAVHRRGWKLGGKIIQSAKVTVNCHPE